ncbi:helix-turn-helix transcriptional regulator [Streptomyces sp. NPDC126499]|uniref:helix-turn-helix domain-containing protein n=1 Tax=Streptomyces sp. NPDC126499 TaxID=3155314 RepID=UPI0033252C79
MPRSDGKRAAARAIAARAEAAGWTSWQTAVTITAEIGCGLLQAHRLARGWTLDDARRRLLAVGARVTVQQLSGWENGKSRPGDENLDRLCRVYATRPDRLGYGHDYTPSHEAAVEPLAELPPSRPDPEAMTVDTSRPPASLAALRAGTTALLTGSVSETTLDQLERRATEHGHEYQILPPADLLVGSVTDFQAVKGLLAARQPADIRVRLCRIAAQLAGTTGIALVALGEHREARSWYHLGQLLAEETGDRALRAWLLAREAVIPLYFGAPAAALALAERARLVAGSAVCATAAWAPALEARALARMGRAREAQDALKLAQTAFARLSAADTSDTAYGYTERQLVWHSGSMWTTLGDTRRAQAALHQARDMYAPTEYLDRALIAMDEAQSLVAVGEVSVACRAAESLLLGLPREHLTGIVVSRAREVLAAIPGRAAGSAPVRELHELVSSVPALTADAAPEAVAGP